MNILSEQAFCNIIKSSGMQFQHERIKLVPTHTMLIELHICVLLLAHISDCFASISPTPPALYTSERYTVSCSWKTENNSQAATVKSETLHVLAVNHVNIWSWLSFPPRICCTALDFLHEFSAFCIHQIYVIHTQFSVFQNLLSIETLQANFKNKSYVDSIF